MFQSEGVGVEGRLGPDLSVKKINSLTSKL